jgi:hypothetical protein
VTAAGIMRILLMPFPYFTWNQMVSYAENVTLSLKSSVFCDITSSSPLKVNQHFGGICRHHLQGEIISQARNCRDPCCFATCFTLVTLGLWTLSVFFIGHRDPARWPRDTIYLQKLALTSTSGGRLVGIVCSWSLVLLFIWHCISTALMWWAFCTVGCSEE